MAINLRLCGVRDQTTLYLVSIKKLSRRVRNISPDTMARQRKKQRNGARVDARRIDETGSRLSSKVKLQTEAELVVARHIGFGCNSASVWLTRATHT